MSQSVYLVLEVVDGAVVAIGVVGAWGHVGSVLVVGVPIGCWGVSGGVVGSRSWVVDWGRGVVGCWGRVVHWGWGMVGSRAMGVHVGVTCLMSTGHCHADHKDCYE